MVLAQPESTKWLFYYVLLFPSHIGSRSTVHCGKGVHRCCFVSIPHWFSLNDIIFESVNQPARSFHPTLVLAQRIVEAALYFLPKSSFHPTLVLAQPAIDRDDSITAIVFPSHIGSRSTCWTLNAGSHGSSFHPTLVLAQHDIILVYSYSCGSFHPTLVLAQQVLNYLREPVPTGVSIPHWFSLNQNTGVAQYSPVH